MTDQQLDNSIESTTRLAESQATGDFNNIMAATDASPIDVDPHPKPFVELSKKGVASHTSVVECSLGSITLTSTGSGTGASLNWHQLPFGNDTNNAVTAIINYFSLWDTPFNLLVNLPRINVPASTAPSPLPFGQADVSFYYYWANKLNSVKYTWKDFMFTVERTSSGGIQFKDEPVFEFALLPSDLDDGPSAAGNSGITWTQPAGKGFSKTYAFGGGWGPITDLYSTQDANGTVYRKVGDWFRTQSATAGIRPLWDRCRRPTMLSGLDDTAWVRCRNIPIGLTNVQIDIKFTVEVEANWDFKYYNATADRFVENNWTPVNTATGRIGRSIDLKHKLTDEPCTKSKKQKA